MTDKQYIVVAHRGAAGYEVENTRAAFERALGAGAHMLEFDVRLTADGVPIVFHDQDLQRVAGIQKKVAEFDWPTLKRIVLPNGESIPSVAEIFDTFGRRTMLDVELKEPAALEPVLRLIHEQQLLERVILTSFSGPTILKAKERCPEIRTGLIMGVRTTNPIVRLQEFFPFPILRKARADYLVLHYSLAHRLLVTILHRLQYRVFLWSSLAEEHEVNQKYFKRCLDLTPDGIATIWPDQLQT